MSDDGSDDPNYISQAGSAVANKNLSAVLRDLSNGHGCKRVRFGSQEVGALPDRYLFS